MTSSKIFENFLTNLSELLFYMTSQNLVLITFIELKLSAFFDNDGIETVFVTCFSTVFKTVFKTSKKHVTKTVSIPSLSKNVKTSKISFWPIFWVRLILNLWPSTFRNHLINTLLWSYTWLCKNGGKRCAQNMLRTCLNWPVLLLA